MEIFLIILGILAWWIVGTIFLVKDWLNLFGSVKLSTFMFLQFVGLCMGPCAIVIWYDGQKNMPNPVLFRKKKK